MTVLHDLLPCSLELSRRELAGIYNFCNPGAISHNQCLEQYKKYVDPDFTWSNFTVEEQNKILAAKLQQQADCSKLVNALPDMRIPDIHTAAESRESTGPANAAVVAKAPETCDFDGAVKGRRRRSTVCADVIHYEGRDVRWFGYARAPTPKLRLSELRAEITNLHTRVLTRGRRGSLRATAVISGADADASSLLHDFLRRLVARLLAECGGAAFEFATTVVGDAPGGPRVRMVGKTEDEVAFTVILTLAAENGALALRSPEVYLSTVAVDASARSGAAFAVAEIGPGPGAEVRLVSSRRPWRR
ncbi:dTDP-glucose 4,6-dehydratase [Aureococcus anophagefferens]|nr:dTDP-glucose 4,6-dehydratase [Aureococcus anophagefferens]